MAAVTNLLWLNSDSIPQSIVLGDTVTAPGNWTFQENVDILGNLTVTGSITSGSTLNSVSQDAFFDLGFGYLLNSANQPGGFTLDTRLAAGFVPGNVTAFPTLTTFVYANAGASTLLVAGDVVMLTNLPGALQANEGYYVVQSVSGAAFPQTVTIYNTSQPGTPWANTAFTATGAPIPPGNAAKINMAVIAVADGTSQFKDADGNSWPVGTVLSAYVTNATLAAFQVNGVYNSIGNTSLQRAYDNGNTIVTDAGLPIAFTLTNGDFTVDGTDSILVGQSTAVEQFAVNTGATGIDLESSVGGTIDIGTLAVAPPVGTQTVQIPALGNNTFIQPNGFLQSPGWPGSYSDNSNGYTVFSAIPNVLRVISGTINTENNFDFVRVYDGAGTGGTLLATFTGIGTSFGFASAANQQFTVAFTSDLSIPSSGFNLTVTGYTSQSINVGTGGGRVVTLGGTTTPTISAEAFAVNISTSSLSSIVNVGTGAGNKNVTIGSTNGNSSTTIEGGGTATSINIGSAATIGSINIGNATTNRPINIGTALGSGSISIGTSTSTGRSISIGSNTGTTSVTIQGGASGSINIGTSAVDSNINIGTSGSAGRTITIGTTSNGALRLRGGNGTGASAAIIVTTGASGEIVVGGSTSVSDFGSGAVSIASSLGARTVNIGAGTANNQAINIGTGAAVKTVTVGSTNSTSATTLQSGTGAMTFTAGGIWDVNAVGAVTIDSSAGTIGIGTDAVNQAINVGTAGVRTVTVGNQTGASGLILNGGTGNILVSTGATTGNITLTNTSTGILNLFNDTGTGAVNLVGAAATGTRTVDIATGGVGAKTVTLGSVASTSSMLIQSGTGSWTATAGGIFDVNAVGTVTVDSSGGSIGIGTDVVNQPINIGTAGARVVTVGNITGASEVDIFAGTGGITLSVGATTGPISIGDDAGTGQIKVGTGAAAKVVTVGSTNTTSATNIQSGSGNTNLSSNGGQVISTANVMLNGASGGIFVQADVGLNNGNIVVIEGTTNPANPLVPRVKLADATAGTELSEKFFAGVVTPATIGAGLTGTIAAMYGTPVGVNFTGAGQPTSAAQCGQPVYLSTTPGLATMTPPSASGDVVYRIGFLISSTSITALRFGVLLAPQFINLIP